MKKIFLVITFFTTMFFINKNVNAYTYNISANKYTAYPGDEIVVKLSTNDVMGFWQMVSLDTSVLSGPGDGGSIDSGDPFYKEVRFKAEKPGTAVVKVSPMSAGLNVYSTLEKLGDITININVIERPVYTPIEINRTYSDNNYISSLAIDGYEIKPEFNKDVLEYSLELDYTVEKINISANPEDERTTINGLGEKEVNEGNNEIKITAVAENGNERVYTINVLVKEIDPIEVKVNGKKYTLLKKESLLPKVDDFDKKTIKIDNKNIPALYNVKTKYTLVGLKDDKGQIELYIYNDKDKSYTKYNEISFNGLRVNFLENNNNNYKEVTIKINGQHINAYKKKGLDYYLVYGMNIKTGKKNWYTYDKEEKTLQRYIDSSNLSTDFDKNFIILLGSISGVLIFFLFVLSIKYKTKKIS